MMKIFALAFSIVFTNLCLGQTVQLKSYSSFHPSYYDAEFGALEDVSEDEGGILYLFVENASVWDSIVNVELIGLDGSSYTPYGWHSIPRSLESSEGNFCGLTIKGTENPLVLDAFCKVVIETANGELDSIEINTLKTPELKIANLIPSQSHDTLFIYVRNDGDSPVTINSLDYNNTNYPLPSSLLSILGSVTVLPNEIRILKLFPGFSFETNDPALISLNYTLSGFEKNTCAVTRIVEPAFKLGSWHSSVYNPENEEGRKNLRRLGMQTFQGPGNYSLMYDGFNRYHLQTIREANFGDPFDPASALLEVSEYADSAMMDVWIIDDEPDLNGKDIASQLQKFETYRRGDTSTSIYINLAVQKKFQRYGFYSDIVGMDHYSAPNAPNIIPLTWIPSIGRMGELEESLRYSEALKYNTEPRRNWSWVQFATSTWDFQPDPKVFDYQFWAHIMGGAKSMKYFAANSQSIADFPLNWNEALLTYHSFKQVRNLVLYGEPCTKVQSDNPMVLTKALIGPESMAVIAINNNITFSGDIFSGFETHVVDEVSNIDVWVPNWISQEDIYMVTPYGKNYDLSVTMLASDSIRISFPEPIKYRSYVIVIGANDATSPEPLNGLKFSQYIDSANYTFSWKESYDNIGTMGYKVYFNNQFITSVKAPIYEIKDCTTGCSGWWKFEPFDNSGNYGDADSLFMFFSSSSPAILNSSNDTVVFIGDSLSLFAETNYVQGYQWQIFDSLSMSWINLTENSVYGNINEPILKINGIPQTSVYRCLITDPCSGAIQLSEEIIVSIINDLGLNKYNLHTRIYPNPASNGKFNFESNFSGKITIYSIEGKVVQEATTQNGITSFQLKNSGTYFVSFTSINGNAVEKIIVP